MIKYTLVSWNNYGFCVSRPEFDVHLAVAFLPSSDGFVAAIRPEEAVALGQQLINAGTAREIDIGLCHGEPIPLTPALEKLKAELAPPKIRPSFCYNEKYWDTYEEYGQPL